MTKTKTIKAPFPYFGGKSKVAPIIWERFGTVRNYVEPFFGSGAVLLNRPTPFDGVETVNDADGLVANFWRALQADSDAVAYHADWPVNENDLHARHAWIVGRKESLQSRLEGDPDYHDVKIAGWWVWGMACWIGGGFCSGKGPWKTVNGRLVKDGGAGQGVNRQRVELSPGRGVYRKLVDLGPGRGVKRNAGQGLREYLADLAARMRHVRVCCGDWSRVCGPTPTVGRGLTAVFLDPPYADTAKRDSRLYRVDSMSVAHDVREWAIEQGNNPRLRICLAGYEGEHKMPSSWECVGWKANGGYASQSQRHDNPNAWKERLWFSPHCLPNTSRRRRTSTFSE